MRNIVCGIFPPKLHGLLFLKVRGSANRVLFDYNFEDMGIGNAIAADYIAEMMNIYGDYDYLPLDQYIADVFLVEIRQELWNSQRKT